MPRYEEELHMLRDDEQRWLYFLRHASSLTQEDARRLGEDIMTTKQRLYDLSQNKDFYAIAITREKQMRDLPSWKHEVREEGREEGLKQGLEQGRLLMLREVLLLTLPAKSGVSASIWEARLEPLSLAQLEALYPALLQADSEEAMLALLPSP